jgi:hypothetical protein
LTNESEYNAVVGEVEAWKLARAQEGLDVMVTNMAVAQRQVAVLVGSDALADLARRLVRPDTVGVADVQGLLAAGGINLTQQIASGAQTIQSLITSQADSVMGIVNQRREVQLREQVDQRSAEAGRMTEIVAQQIERAGDLLGRRPELSVNVGSDATLEQLTAARDTFRAFALELGNAQRQVQDTLRDLPDSFDAGARQQLVDARDRLQDRFETMTDRVNTLTFQISLLENNATSRNEADVNQQVGAGNRAIDLWNGRFNTSFTLAEFPNIKAPIHGISVSALDAAFQEIVGVPLDFNRLAQAPMIQLLNEQSPDWVLQIDPTRNAPYTAAEARQLRQDALDRARQGDRDNGRDVVIPVETWRRIVGGRVSSNDAGIGIPGFLGENIPS